jgi:hypothetical protein
MNQLSIYKQLNNRSIKKIQNPGLIKQYIKEFIDEDKAITFYNWECPPRVLDNGQVNYLVDLKKIFKGQKIDKYTELPRVVEQRDREIKILEFLNSLGIRYRFVKVIADTNAYFLSPESLKKYGKSKIQKAFRDFRKRIIFAMKNYPADTNAYLFSDMIAKNQGLYNRSFKQALKLLKLNQLLPEKIIQLQNERTRDHVGIDMEEQVKQFSFRTISSYAAEGIVFSSLTKTGDFSNCVWLNIEEVDDRTIAITDCLRLKQGSGSLPMVFLR